MEAGGTISTEAGTLGELLTSCGEQVSGIGTWEGPSQESISEQVESFVGEYNAITTQMTAFAEACDTYLEYARLYKAMKEKEKERDAAEEKDKQGYQNDIDAMLEDLGTLKGNISSALGDASSPSLTANALNASISASILGSDGEPVSFNAAAGAPDGLIQSTKSGYVFPFAEGVDAPVTSSVGNRDQPIAGATTNHKGTDIGVPIGTEVHSLSGGTVLHAGQAQGYGQWVQIQQDDGNIVTYGHVSKYDFFQEGDRVEAGDVVALTGNEGVSTGPHLHLQIEDPDGNVLNSEYLFEDCWPS